MKNLSNQYRINMANIEVTNLCLKLKDIVLNDLQDLQLTGMICQGGFSTTVVGIVKATKKARVIKMYPKNVVCRDPFYTSCLKRQITYLRELNGAPNFLCKPFFLRSLSVTETQNFVYLRFLLYQGGWRIS